MNCQILAIYYIAMSHNVWAMWNMFQVCLVSCLYCQGCIDTRYVLACCHDDAQPWMQKMFDVNAENLFKRPSCALLGWIWGLIFFLYWHLLMATCTKAMKSVKVQGLTSFFLVTCAYPLDTTAVGFQSSASEWAVQGDYRDNWFRRYCERENARDGQVLSTNERCVQM